VCVCAFQVSGIAAPARRPGTVTFLVSEFARVACTKLLGLFGQAWRPHNCWNSGLAGSAPKERAKSEEVGGVEELFIE
jgi:hypothetical protein